jgi:hypothetical protein
MEYLPAKQIVVNSDAACDTRGRRYGYLCHIRSTCLQPPWTLHRLPVLVLLAPRLEPVGGPDPDHRTIGRVPRSGCGRGRGGRTADAVALPRPADAANGLSGPALACRSVAAAVARETVAGPTSDGAGGAIRGGREVAIYGGAFPLEAPTLLR